MKKLLLTYIVIIATVGASFSQDIIYKKNGDEIKAKVNKIGSQDIEYTKFDNVTGPSYSIAKAEVLLIIYSNGSKDMFPATETPLPVNNANDNKPLPTVRPQSKYRGSDIFNKTSPLVWYGVDYSKVKLNNVVLENSINVFSEINNLILNEKTRYDYRGAMRKPAMTADIAAVEKINSQIDIAQLQSGTGNPVTWTDLQAIIDKYSEYESNSKDGIGMVLIAENLSKGGPSGTGSYYVLFFDIATKNIIISDKLIGGAGGSSQRNFWARTVLESIQKIKDTKYGQWRYANR